MIAFLDTNVVVRHLTGEPVEQARRAKALLADARRLLLRALELYEHTPLHFADAYLVASAELSGLGAVASFDRAIDGVASVRRIESV